MNEDSQQSNADGAPLADIDLCRPPDMRSFITSYLSATLWNTCSAARQRLRGLHSATAPDLRYQPLLQLVRDSLKPEVRCGCAGGGQAEECLLGARVVAAAAAAPCRAGEAPCSCGRGSARAHGKMIHERKRSRCPQEMKPLLSLAAGCGARAVSLALQGLRLRTRRTRCGAGC